MGQTLNCKIYETREKHFTVTENILHISRLHHLRPTIYLFTVFEVQSEYLKGAHLNLIPTVLLVITVQTRTFY